jgi:hypothetical protein
MYVIIHQAIGVHLHSFLVGDLSQSLQIFTLIETIAEDLHLPDTAGDHMMRYIFQNETRYPSHRYIRNLRLTH